VYNISVEHMTHFRCILVTRPKQMAKCHKKTTGGLHLDRCESGGGGGLCWVGLARAFKRTKV
jgi:hypothetical protein